MLNVPERKSRVTRAGFRVAVVLSVLVSLVLPPHGAAFAANCPEENIVYMRPNVNSGQGVITTNRIRDVALDTTCATRSARGSTALILSQDHTSWAEVGWIEENAGLLTPPSWHPFWEYGVAGVGIRTNGTDVTPGGWARFKMYGMGDGHWKFFFDGNNDNVFETQFGPTGGQWVAGLPSGRSEGETFRHGPLVSGYDHHVNLYWRNSTGTWFSWPAQTYDGGAIADYHYQFDAGNEYEIVHN